MVFYILPEKYLKSEKTNGHAIRLFANDIIIVFTSRQISFHS